MPENTQKQLNIGVFFGSRSAEHDVSIITALVAIIKPLRLTRAYNIVPVYISKKGQWYSDPALAEIALYSSGNIDTWLERHTPVLVDLNGGLRIVHPALRNQSVTIDVAFPATHGTFGEDGSLMGIFEMAGIPYVGCGVSASALAMDKVLAKEVTAAAGVHTNEYFWFTSAEFEKDQSAIVDVCTKMSFPLFVKPAHLGSSIGISRVTTKEALINAIEVAAFYDEKIIVEEAVANLIEVSVPVMGNDQPRAANTEQPIQGEDFFDFDTKYIAGGKGGKGGAKTSTSGGKGTSGAQGYSQIPAKISDALNAECKQIAINVYRALGCSGMARVDLLLDSKSQKVYFNEINPLPGSLYAHNWRSAGVSNVDLVQTLITLAQERHAARAKLTTTFDTNFLKQF